jgi:hypothetical protein
MSVTGFDFTLTNTLTAQRDKLAAELATFRRKHGGCACDESGCCAYHADVHNRLQDAIKSLDLAIRTLQIPDGGAVTQTSKGRVGNTRPAGRLEISRQKQFYTRS